MDSKWLHYELGIKDKLIYTCAYKFPWLSISNRTHALDWTETKDLILPIAWPITYAHT